MLILSSYLKYKVKILCFSPSYKMPLFVRHSGPAVDMEAIGWPATAGEPLGRAVVETREVLGRDQGAAGPACPGGGPDVRPDSPGSSRGGGGADGRSRCCSSAGPPGNYRKGGVGPPSAFTNMGTQPAGLRQPRLSHRERRPGGGGEGGIAPPTTGDDTS
ncbi:UNVERIFIED_CONTAM: hypothetical protein K2H54_043534 [Gekko kuhli]